MELEIIKGGGIIDNQIIEANIEGEMVTKWKLGHDSNDQVIKAKIYDSTNRLYSEFEIRATAFLPNDWNNITSEYLTCIRDMVFDTVNNRSLMLSKSTLYTKEDKFYKWNEIHNSSNINLKDIEINSKGELFGGGWDGNLYKSIDWGKSWAFIYQPIPDYSYNFELSISGDDYIWASKWEHGVYCSKDGGLSWQNDTLGIPKEEQLGRVYKFDNNSHLALSLQIMQTFDCGITWQAINTPKYSQTMFVTDENEIIAQNQEQGFSLHKSTDSGSTYKKVLSASVAYGTTSNHNFLKFKSNYYILAPGGGIYKTKDFEEFEKIVSFNLQRNLFIDHAGTIYAGGFYNEPVLILPNNE